MVEEDNTPLSITVTPCDAPLEWKLSLQELPEEASGEGSGEYPARPGPSPWDGWVAERQETYSLLFIRQNSLDA